MVPKKSRFCPKGPNFANVASFRAKSQIPNPVSERLHLLLPPGCHLTIAQYVTCLLCLYLEIPPVTCCLLFSPVHLHDCSPVHLLLLPPGLYLTIPHCVTCCPNCPVSNVHPLKSPTTHLLSTCTSAMPMSTCKPSPVCVFPTIPASQQIKFHDLSLPS